MKMVHSQMTNPLHALDSFFYSSMGVYAFQTQCEMLAELGYDGITVSGWSGKPLTDLGLLPTVKARYGLTVRALYLVLHEGRNDQAIARLVNEVEGTDLIELAIQSTQNGIDGMLRNIEALLRIVERRGLKIALYPHLRHVTQTTEEVIRLCQYFNHSRLGASFNGFHWYASETPDIAKALENMRPWLMQVVLSGSARSPLGWGGVATMEPIDRGELDNFQVLAALNQIGYEGSIGFLGWDYGGDIYLKLERCLATTRAMMARV